MLIEGAGGRLHPFEFKLSATPSVEMAAPIRKFREDFAALKPETGAIVSLTASSRTLSADARLLTLPDFLHQAVEKGVFSQAPTGELPGME